MGFNSRLDSVQAAVLAVKLPYLDAWNARRNAVAARYLAAFSEISDLVRPIETGAYTTRHAYHLFVLRAANGQRDRIVQTLQARGVGAVIHYPIAIHQQAGFRPLVQPGWRLSLTERMASDVFSLPLCPDITDEEAQIVIDEVLAAVNPSRVTVS
jgi:dTDP-3-amino-3,4,6-trideoxy-alpha-D-glucose transaminase